jgi:broad specificity phosphatase PhoE
MTLLFIRHGETALNVARVYQPADTPLSPRGQAQAEAVGARLLAFAPVAVLSSDMPRALQTAQAIIAANPRLPLQTSTLLHERNFGDFRGQSHASLGFDAVAMDDAPPNGESMADFDARADQALALALSVRAQLDGPLVVVSHGLLIKSLLRRRIALPAGSVVPDRVGNTSVTRVSPQPPHQADLVDCTAHLQGRIAEDGNSLSGG